MNRYKNQNKVTLFKVRSGITREAYDPFSGEFKGGGGYLSPFPQNCQNKVKAYSFWHKNDNLRVL